MKLTVVTICYNDLEGLKATVESLRKQTTREFEHWVIDGASRDGTPEYLNSLEVPWTLRFVSEKDRGIYHAMNKGTERASSDFVWFLNSGDCCADEKSIQNWIEALEKHPDADLLYGRVWFRGSDFTKSVGNPARPRDFWSGMPLGHQGIIYRRSILLKTPYREDLRIVSDWVLTEWFFENTKTAFVSAHFAIFNLEGVSAQNIDRVFKEKFRAEKSPFKKIYLMATMGSKFSLIRLLKKVGIYGPIQRFRHRSRELTSQQAKNT